MKLSDYVAQKVADLGINHVFMVTGGGAMHLNHSLGINDNLECIFNHHEQACAMAAESYYRLTNKLALVNVTSGPGGTNTITGVYGAFVDSIGMIVVSGQVKYETTVRSTGLPLRQYGDQELDIEQLVRPITKYVVMVTDPSTIRYHLEKAFYLARSGRPGPCWIDIPLDVQGAEINENDLPSFNPSEIDEPWKETDINNSCIAIVEAIKKSKRPVIFAGSGVRLSGKNDAFIKVVEKFCIPLVTGWNAHDVIYDSHPLYAGRPGTVGDRPGNFTVQNADLLIIFGSRLNIRQVSYNWDSFSKDAYKIWIDIDEIEMKKPTVKADLMIHADLSDFIPVLLKFPYESNSLVHQSWVRWCVGRRSQYPVVLNDYCKTKKVNPYCFIDKLFKQLPKGQITVAANGSACVMSFQAGEVKKRQRLWTNSGCASMGYDIPAAIGACIASNKNSVVCLAGDGSVMMNLQELQTITTLELPIKIFIINNNGYASISQTQRNFFNGVEVGAGPSSGVLLPDFSKIANAFNMPFFRIKDTGNLDKVIRNILELDSFSICEVMVDESQVFSPKLSARKLSDGTIVSPSLEDMSPFLPREELKNNMIKNEKA